MAAEPADAGPAEQRTPEPDSGRRGQGRRPPGNHARDEHATPPGQSGHPGRDSHPGGHGRDSHPGGGHGRDLERGWRELAGSSPSQVGLNGALRARDVARPSPEDLAAAERSVVLVRRGWQPPDD